MVRRGEPQSKKYYRQWYMNNREKKIVQTRLTRAAERTRLPPVVYAWFNTEGEAEYVGRGAMRRSRVHKNSSWYTSNHFLITMTCENEWEAMEYEGKWGGRYLPKHNKDGYRYAGSRKIS